MDFVKYSKMVFECDCTGIFYKGKICEEGILKVPEISPVSINQKKLI